MWAELVVAFMAGGVAHKVWRATWRSLRHPVSFRHALSDEFVPPNPEVIDERRKRTSRVSEVV